MNMRDRIALAIKAVQARPHTDDEIADAVLDTLSDPTEGMRRAGEKVFCEEEEIFRAMIQAAKEGK